MIIITLVIVIFLGVSIFNNNEKNTDRLLAYFYDGKGHSEPPKKNADDSQYARIDGGTSSPGYFTYKAN